MNIEKMIFIEDESNPLNGRPEEQHKKHGYVWRHMWLAENDSGDRNILNGIVKTMQNHVTELYKTQQGQYHRLQQDVSGLKTDMAELQSSVAAIADALNARK